MKVFTIGFTKSKASRFFNRLQVAGVTKVIDTRLNRVSQLSGFAKQDDLEYFLDSICSISYSINNDLAPTSDILDAYKKKEIGWAEYERRYLYLISSRKVELKISESDLNGACLLCSEATPEHCHRRLAVNYLADFHPGINIVHL
ncbi:DUF488 domain-containing protein [Sphingomonas sp. SORGH_AS_0438]|uniref:DUF488 domain-containing protein n=1 Tax=Sphingomonas sp. SORGH_AS_0438 TaxID=3041756 RepID=UPI00286373DF|nr:DUF488 domain-containing protein [Sphingomonas sp. SORGH_AS_0438]MDR6129084.1 uncharacterized protein (DUF488 family) [Sphingomonas sp. SORGH_AS_0438]